MQISSIRDVKLYDETLIILLMNGDAVV
jgi:hypothetical protein